MVKNRVARGGAHRMSLIREAVHEGCGAAFECLDDARANKHGAQRRVTAGDSFPHQNHVRVDASVLNGKVLARASHAGHHFVRDEENFVLVADFRDTRTVTFGRHCGAKSGADERLENESSGLTGLVFEQVDFEVVRAPKFALRKSFFKRAVIAEARRDVSPFREERFVGSAAGALAADRHRPRSAALITLAAGGKSGGLPMASFQGKLVRQYG